MEVIAEIRRRHWVSGESISSIARDLKLSRPTVRKHLQTENEVVYRRSHQPAPKLGEFQAVLAVERDIADSTEVQTVARADLATTRHLQDP